MDQLALFQATITLAKQHGMPADPGSPLGLDHLSEMCRQAEGFDDQAKIGRWLGWAQCAVVAASLGLTLEDMKALNTTTPPERGRIVRGNERLTQMVGADPQRTAGVRAMGEELAQLDRTHAMATALVRAAAQLAINELTQQFGNDRQCGD